VLNVQAADTAALERGRDRQLVEAANLMRARPILRFHEKENSLLISGLLAGGSELAGRAAVVDAPLGQGHVVYFAIRPFWRWQTQGSFALALNAIANWNGLGREKEAVADASNR
jgi:hypothetical protein